MITDNEALFRHPPLIVKRYIVLCVKAAGNLIVHIHIREQDIVCAVKLSAVLFQLPGEVLHLRKGRKSARNTFYFRALGNVIW